MNIATEKKSAMAQILAGLRRKFSRHKKPLLHAPQEIIEFRMSARRLFTQHSGRKFPHKAIAALTEQTLRGAKSWVKHLHDHADMYAPGAAHQLMCDVAHYAMAARLKKGCYEAQIAEHMLLNAFAIAILGYCTPDDRDDTMDLLCHVLRHHQGETL